MGKGGEGLYNMHLSDGLLVLANTNVAFKKVNSITLIQVGFIFLCKSPNPHSFSVSDSHVNQLYLIITNYNHPHKTLR